MLKKSVIGTPSTELSMLLLKLKLHGISYSVTLINPIFLSLKILEFLSTTLKSDIVSKLLFSIITASLPSLASQLATISNFAASFSFHRFSFFSSKLQSQKFLIVLHL